MNGLNKWAKRGVWLTFAGVLTIGCSPLQTVAFIFHKDDKVAAAYPLRPKDGPKKDKDEEITVLVICGQHQSSSLPYEFAGADRDLSSVIAKRLPDEAKANKEKITVLPPSQFDKFKMANPNWRSTAAAKIGKQLGADYVIDIELSNLQVFQPGSRNMLYEGRAEAFVHVYEVAAGDGDAKYRYPLQFVYRPNHTPDVSEVPLSRYKQGFLDRLALEIIWQHLEHRPADGIAAER